ncbi:MAG: D-alanyl-D-alanine carboxypeptidase, partial [Clostridia bacterium]|nr:D-alanyl-D-alanine carboxypeptidase [Clostridia bacterium]
QNETAHYPIASVTKIMSTLLVAEAIDSGRIKMDDIVTVGEAAAKMGGSQVYLEAGEQMSVRDLLKAMTVVSANDATVAFAEHIAGSEASFVTMMNERASGLGMDDTVFKNCHGLNEEGHFSSALDVALMTRELLKHEFILEFTTIWMDTVRNGSFGLANTNKLIRFYSGANGMKTGFTDLAKYCLSGTAKRDGMQLIAVIIGAETSDERFASAKKLLDYGFANYAVTVPQKEELGLFPVENGYNGSVGVDYTPPSVLVSKGKAASLTSSYSVPELTAPVNEGDVVGSVDYYIDGEHVARADVCAVSSDRRITFWDEFFRVLRSALSFY